VPPIAPSGGGFDWLNQLDLSDDGASEPATPHMATPGSSSRWKSQRAFPFTTPYVCVCVCLCVCVCVCVCVCT
jgi:hypothetical protein